MRNRKYIKGFTGSLIFALIGSIPWIVLAVTTSFFISILGFVIGSAALYGYKKFDGLINKNTKWFILASTFIAIVFAETMTSMILIANDGYDFSFYNLQILFSIPGFLSQFCINVGIGMLIAYFGIKQIIDSF